MSTPVPSPARRPVSRSSRRMLKIAAWTGGGIVALLVLVVITAVVLLNSARFHAYVLNTAQKQASESLGVRVQLQNYKLNLAAIGLDLYGVTVDGASPYANPPLLQVDHAEASVRIVSIFQRKWYLQDIRIDRPIVRVFVDKNGVSNIPTIKSSSNSNSNTSVFDLGIRHAVLDKGEVYYNDRKSVLDADLHNVDFNASFDASVKRYSGRLAYSDGHLVSGSLKPLSHDLVAEFDATPGAARLTHATLSVGTSKIDLVASVINYNSPIVDAQYDAILDGDQFQKILNSPSVPSGFVHATGKAHYDAAGNRPLLEALEVHGDLSSSRLGVKTPSLRAQINHLLAHYALVNGDATLEDLRAGVLGGELTAQGTMSHLAGDSHTKVNAALKGISLASAKQLLGKSAMPQNITLGGTLNATATASWGRTINDLVAHADATIDGRVSGSGTTLKGVTVTGPATNNVLPLNSAVHATYTNSDQQIALTNTYLRTPQTNLTANGLLSNHSSLNLRLQADDLREVETLADMFRQPAPGQALQPLGLAGTASFQGNVQGSLSAPHLTGQLVASNLRVQGTEWKVIRAGVDASPSSASVQHADLELATRGKITLNASAGLTQWSFTKNSPVEVRMDAKDIALADLEKVAGQQVPVTGTLNASVNVKGTELSPVGNGNLALTNVSAYGEPVQQVKLTFEGTGREVHGNLGVSLPAGSLQSTMSVRPQEKTYSVQVQTTGIQLNKLQSLKASNVDANGVLTVKASGQGSFDNPQLYATLQIPQLVVQHQTIQAINLQMNVANHLANAALTSSAVNTSIKANAQVHLTGDYLADATLDTQAIPFQPLIAIYAPSQAGTITGQTEIHGTLHGPLKNKNLLEAHVTIPTLTMAYGSTVQLAAAAPIHIDYKNGVVDVQRSTIKGTDTDLQFQGSIPTTGSGSMSVLLQGSVNLQLAQLLDPDYRTSGELKFNLNSYGAANGPDVGGEIDIVDANVASGDLPVGLQHGNGVLKLTKTRLNIASFQGTVGGGTVTAQGGLTFQPSVQFNLGLAAQGIRVLYPQGMRESVDANLTLTGTTENALLGGSVNLADLSFTPAFDLSNFISQFAGGVAAPPSQGFSQNVQLNLAVRSSNDINLVSRTLSIGGSANLQVRGTAADPVILGRVNLSSGDIILNGDRFLLNGGTIQFVNPSETEPVLNVSLNTSIQQYNIFLRFNGPVNQLRTEYSSDPALPQADIINLLAFGSTTEASSANPSTPANQAAESLVASQVSSQVTSRISKIAGISQLSINPVLAGSNNSQGNGANITIQQRVTGNLFVTFTNNVGNTQTQTIQGQYQISPRVAVSATRDQNGGVAFDTLIKKTW